MAKLKNRAARKAAKMTAKHTVHGTASKAKRQPMRSTTLLAIGATFGAVAAWFARARAGGSSTQPTA
jgi:hypothetical protein